MGRVIECSNCGGGGNDLQFYVTLGALLIAALALTMNFIQFREFLRRARARANFKITLHVQRTDENGFVRCTEAPCTVRVEVGLKNVGDLAAGETVINVLAPRSLAALRWCGPGGEEVDAAGPNFSALSKPLPGPDREGVEAQYLGTSFDRVGTKPVHLVRFQFEVDVPEGGETLVPLRVTAQADEIPDEIEDYEADLVVPVRFSDP